MTEYTPAYQDLWETSETNPSRQQEVENAALRITVFKMIYGDIEVLTGIPWQVIAVIHFKEAGLDFTTHLHNGDPLSDKSGRFLRTVKYPPGRPEAPPANGCNYTWKESAIDAIKGQCKSRGVFLTEFQWTLPGSLWFLEAYNGFGYKKRGVNTPYLWSYTQHYTSGLYVESRQQDGTWKTEFHPEKVSQTPGCVPILKRLEYEGR